MFSDPQFWVLIAFIIFIAAVFNPVRKILIKSLDEKINAISENLNNAEKLKEDSQKTLSEIKIKQNQLIKTLDTMKEETRVKIEDNKLLYDKKLNEQINKINELSKIKIDQMIREANMEVQQYIFQSAINVTLDILENKMNDEERSKLIRQSLNDVNSALKN
mgnify:CR=1 FL=1|tara:strand:- start:1351 stop:1836 length:486 start_codon:yes stop_codon:yes gene_type:complete